ncbi:MAG: hypothetical protein JW717_14500 [Marinilabiliaceae bacterium]|nr:hypothetical protein [Marinilabiliaceae bacterium]
MSIRLHIKKTLLLGFFYLTIIPIYSQITLPSLFTDNMVLQQNANVAIWGWSTANDVISIKPSWSEKNTSVKPKKDGSWKTYIKTPSAGKSHSITITNNKNAIEIKNVMIGDVWICAGQSNMEMPMKGFKAQGINGANMDILKSTNNNIRVITVPRSSKTTPQSNFEGEWQQASPASIAEFSATGYYFGRLVNEITDVPIGLICVSYGGSCIEAWMSKETSLQFEDMPIPGVNDTIKSPNRTPTVLYNGMLNPIIGYGIKGAIWYQGETNYKNAQDYTILFYNMVKEWRKQWNLGDFPFYYTQIAPFDYDMLTPNEKSEQNNSAFLRDAQRLAMDTIQNCGMAVLLDQGEEKNIHPANKKVVGERLALWALAKTYNIKGFGYASPTYNEINIKDSSVTVTFKNIPNGITSYGKEVTLFEIAGNDRIFHPATCTLRRKSVILTSSKVKNPIAVRYGFKNHVDAQIFNTEGLPLTSFRTDNW